MIKIFFIFTVLILYAVIENKFIIRVRTEVFNENINRIKIVHLSDLHKRSFGKNNKKLIQKISSQKPDIIIFSGDLISRNCSSLSNISEFITNLVKIAPVYFSLGNHELDMCRLNENIYNEFIAILKKNNVHILDNTSASAVYHKRKINITGASLKNTVYKKNNSYKNLDTYSKNDIFRDLGSPQKDGTNILIAHNPFFAEIYSQWGADYTLSGHVHGGAVRIFNIPLLSPERKFFPKYSKGVFHISNMKLLVSGGLGKIRLFNSPEIAVYYI